MLDVVNTQDVRIRNNHIVTPDKSFRFLIQIKIEAGLFI